MKSSTQREKSFKNTKIQDLKNKSNEMKVSTLYLNKQKKKYLSKSMTCMIYHQMN